MSNIVTHRSGDDYYFLINDKLLHTNIENLKKKNNIFGNLKEIECEKISKNESHPSASRSYNLSLKLYKDSNDFHHYLFYDYDSDTMRIENEFKIKKYIDHQKYMSFHVLSNTNYKLHIYFNKIGLICNSTYSVERKYHIEPDLIYDKNEYSFFDGQIKDMLQIDSRINYVNKGKQILTIATGKYVICYDLTKKRIIEQLDITEFIGNIINSVLFVHKINEHEYFLIVELKDEIYFKNSFNKIIENDDILVWTKIYKTRRVKNYEDLYFSFV